MRNCFSLPWAVTEIKRGLFVACRIALSNGIFFVLKHRSIFNPRNNTDTYIFSHFQIKLFLISKFFFENQRRVEMNGIVTVREQVFFTTEPVAL